MGFGEVKRSSQCPTDCTPQNIRRSVCTEPGCGTHETPVIFDRSSSAMIFFLAEPQEEEGHHTPYCVREAETEKSKRGCAQTVSLGLEVWGMKDSAPNNNKKEVCPLPDCLPPLPWVVSGRRGPFIHDDQGSQNFKSPAWKSRTGNYEASVSVRITQVS